jgi:transposase-like protein
MKDRRKRYSAEEKVAILRRHLLDKVPLSKLCEEIKIQPTVFYRWQKMFFEKGALVFGQQPDKDQEQLQRKVSQLEEKLKVKNEVLSELMEEHLALKKSLGEI